MKTFTPQKEKIKRKWVLIDARGKILGRLSSQVASILQGKDKTIYSPHLDTGDEVIIINARDVLVTGKKPEQKTYYRHSGYPGGLKSIKFGVLFKKKPERVLTMAIKGMLPHNKLGRAMLKKLRVYAGTEHPHQAQNPAKGIVSNKKRKTLTTESTEPERKNIERG